MFSNLFYSLKTSLFTIAGVLFFHHKFIGFENTHIIAFVLVGLSVLCLIIAWASAKGAKNQKIAHLFHGLGFLTLSGSLMTPFILGI